MLLSSLFVTRALSPLSHLSIHLLMFVQSSFSLLKEMEISCSDPAVTEVTNWYPLSQHLQFLDLKVGTPYLTGHCGGLMCLKGSCWLVYLKMGHLQTLICNLSWVIFTDALNYLTLTMHIKSTGFHIQRKGRETQFYKVSCWLIVLQYFWVILLLE